MTQIYGYIRVSARDQKEDRHYAVDSRTGGNDAFKACRRYW